MDPVVPRYPHELGTIRDPVRGEVPIVAVDPEQWPGARGLLMTGGEGVDARWAFATSPNGPAAVLSLAEPGTDLDIRLVFDRAEADELKVLYGASRTGWLGVTSVETFMRLTEGEDPGAEVAWVPVRREDLHEFLTSD